VRSALSFLTPIPVCGARPSGRTLAWFPLVGLVLGASLGFFWRWSADVWPGIVAAALVVALDLGLTGMLHLDGLADSADGLLSHLPRQRRFAVMSAPDIGAFGLGVATLTLILRVSCLAVIVPAPLLLIGLWVASRSLMAATIAGVPYAKDDGGLASAFLVGRPRALVLFVPGAALAMLAGYGWHPLWGTGAVVAGLTAGGAVVALGRRQLGGFTGDVLGAAGMVAETVGLLVAAARL